MDAANSRLSASELPYYGQERMKWHWLALEAVAAVSAGLPPVSIAKKQQTHVMTMETLQTLCKVVLHNLYLLRMETWCVQLNVLEMAWWEVQPPGPGSPSRACSATASGAPGYDTPPSWHCCLSTVRNSSSILSLGTPLRTRGHA
jgi:hypothetical protein